MKRILVATDFSSRAVGALHYAVNLAEKTGAELLVFHSYIIPVYASDAPIDLSAEEETVRNNASQSLNSEVNEIRFSKSNIKIDSLLQEGAVLNTLPGIVKKHNIDLVVMGAKGVSGLKKIMIGSTTAKMLGKAGCPILAVPEGISFKEPRRILFASDYVDSDIQSIKQLIAIASTFNAEVTILHISDGAHSEAYEQSMNEWFRLKVKEAVIYPNTSYKIIQGKDVLKILDNYVNTHNPDIIVMSAKKRTLLDKMTSRSLTKTEVRYTQTPLLVFEGYNIPPIDEF